MIGITTFDRGGPSGVSYDDGTFRASSGDWTMTIDLYDQPLELWRDDTGRILTDLIEPLPTDGGLPAFRLHPPLRWGEDDELPLQMEVIYESFVVQRGCDEASVGCD